MKKIIFLQKARTFIVAHKTLSVIVAIILLWGGYATIKSFSGGTAATQYAIAAVSKGTIVSTVSASGQVSASSQIDLKSKASGNLTSLKIVAGQQVKAGQMLAQVDTRDASISLQNAKINLAKLTEPADAATILQAENSLDSSKQSLVDAQTNLAKYYADALNEVANTFVDIPEAMDGLNTMFYTASGFLSVNKTTGLQSSVKADITSAGAEYDIAHRAYLDLLPIYKTVNRSSATGTVESLISDAYDMTVKSSEALKDTKTVVDYIKSNNLSPSATEATTAQTNLNDWMSKITSHLSALQNVETEIATSKNTIISAGKDIQEKQLALQKLQAGPDALDVQSQQLSLQQQEYNYDDYFIRAPFDGVIAKVDVTKADSVSSGTVIGTLISKQQIAELSLNEVDASKVAVGQKATLTFDAIDGLSITGQVAEVDLLGTVTQGVVTYDVKIAFDVQDERIKPGMTVNATIETAVKQDVITVPNSAVKTTGGQSYVLVVGTDTPVTTGSALTTLSTPPTQQPVTVGISDDLNTEIVSGLNEGDKIVSRTSTKTTTATTSQAPSLFGGGARTSGSAGATRALGK